MRAVVVHHPGGAEVLQLEERPIPDVPDGWVRIRIEAFGINRSEWFTRRGQSPNVAFPRVLGIECVGTVDADPSGELAEGQQVAAIMGGLGRQFDGGYAEYTVVPRRIVFPFTSDLPWATLGAIPEMFQTASGALTAGLDCQPGETLLIRGGTASVGMCAAQIAHRMGLRVLATTRNPDKAPALRAAGVDDVLVDRGTVAPMVRELTGGGAHRTLELVGGTTLLDSLQATRPRGVVCWTGAVSNVWEIADFTPFDHIPHTVRLTTYSGGAEDLDPARLQAFIDAVARGEQRLDIAHVYELADIREAHRHLDQSRGAGKLVVVTSPSSLP